MLTSRSVADIILRCMARNTSSRALTAARTTSMLERWLNVAGVAEHPGRVSCRLHVVRHLVRWSERRPVDGRYGTARRVPGRGRPRRQFAHGPAAHVCALVVLRVRRRARCGSRQPCGRRRTAEGRRRPMIPAPRRSSPPRTVAAYRAAAALIDPRLEALVGLLVCDGAEVVEALALDIDDVSGRAPATAIIVWRLHAPTSRPRPRQRSCGTPLHR